MTWYELDKDVRARVASASVDGYTAIPPTDGEPASSTNLAHRSRIRRNLVPHSPVCGMLRPNCGFSGNGPSNYEGRQIARRTDDGRIPSSLNPWPHLNIHGSG
jgi:hypothetical protein